MGKVMLFVLPVIIISSFSACEKDDSEPRSPLSEWAGEYFTRTQWWGEYFSPVTIDPDGDLFIAGEEIDEYEFDAATRRLTFDWHPVKTTEAKASIILTRFGDNLTFSGSINPRRQDGPVGFRGATMAHTLWQGTYQTETQWWGAYFSPLVIQSDGALTVADTEIDFTFDPVNKKLSFDWHAIKTTEATAEITFEEEDWDLLKFSGRIKPRRQDGWVGYSGVRE